MWSIVAVAILLVVPSQAHQGDAKCQRQAGICQLPSEPCNLGEYRGPCGANNQGLCCVRTDADRQCRFKGGTCQDESLRCDGGRIVDNYFCSEGNKCCVPYEEGDCGQHNKGAVCAGENDFPCAHGVTIVNEYSRCEGPDAHCCLSSIKDPKCHENIVRSTPMKDGMKEVTVHFTNTRGDTVTLYNVDHDGTEVIRGHILASKTRQHQSYPGQSWVFRDAHDDIIYYKRTCQYIANGHEDQKIHIDYEL